MTSNTGLLGKLTKSHNIKRGVLIGISATGFVLVGAATVSIIYYKVTFKAENNLKTAGFSLRFYSC